MEGVYHIIIRQTNNPELVLAFPRGIDHLVNYLFQEQYRIGQEFIDDLEYKKQSILDAIADHFAPQRNFRYSIEDNKLFLQIPLIIDQYGHEKYHYTNEEYNAMTMLACFAANYVHIKDAIDPNDGPIDIQGTYDEKTHQSYTAIGAQAMHELMIVLSSPEKLLPAEEDTSVSPKVVWSGLIKSEPVLGHIN
tara:strand:- start:284 stop:859 length:576 start_codon:yes stop_codon:yes gene_type:complete